MTLIYLRKHTTLVFVVLFTFLGIGLGIAVQAHEHDPFADIQYPIADLGHCGSERECMAYCDEISHMKACIAFAEEHRLLPPEKISEAKKFIVAGARGPGGCHSRQSCDNYCRDVRHINECIAFGEAHDLIPHKELAEAKKVATALASGAKLPGGCTSQEACRQYCTDDKNIEECLRFGESAGLIPAHELAEAKKFLAFVKGGGKTPGNCRGKEACHNYCEQEDHFAECTEFAVSAGFIPPEEADMIRKTGGRGPGNCQGREACETYCNNPDHQDTCFAFAKEHGLISDADMTHVREGLDRMRTELRRAPPEVLACLKEKIGPAKFAKLQSGEAFMPSPRFGDAVRHCFEVFGGFHDRVDTDHGEGIHYNEGAYGEHEEDGGKMLPPEEGWSREERMQTHSLPPMEPEVASCVHVRLGDDFKERMQKGSIEPHVIAETVRSCMEKYMQLKVQMRMDGQNATYPDATYHEQEIPHYDGALSPEEQKIQYQETYYQMEQNDEIQMRMRQEMEMRQEMYEQREQEIYRQQEMETQYHLEEQPMSGRNIRRLIGNIWSAYTSLFRF